MSGSDSPSRRPRRGAGADLVGTVRPRKGPVWGVAAVVAVLLLSGCGQPAPGVAAEVEGDEITQDQVDDFAEVLCALGSVQAAQAQTPSRAARFSALEILLGNELAFDLAAGVDVDQATINASLQQLNASREVLPADLVDTFDVVAEDFARAQAGILAVGRASLKEAGEDPVGDQQAFNAGEELRQEYAETADVEVDPRFGEVIDGRLTPTDGSLSVPVSDLAVQATSDEPPPELTEMLPDSQKCG